MRSFSVILPLCIVGCCATNGEDSAKERARERVALIVSEFLDSGQGRNITNSTEQLVQMWPSCADHLIFEVAQRPYRRGTMTPEEYSRSSSTDPPPEILVRGLALNVFADARTEDIIRNDELRQLLRAIALDDVMPTFRAQAISILAKGPSTSDLEILVLALRDGTGLLHGGTVAEVALDRLERLLEGIEGLPTNCELSTQKERDIALALWMAWWRGHESRMEFDPKTERFRSVE